MEASLGTALTSRPAPARPCRPCAPAARRMPARRAAPPSRSTPGAGRPAVACQAESPAGEQAGGNAPPSFAGSESRPVKGTTFPDAPGVYAVSNVAGEVQYIGLSRKVSATVAGYARDLPELTHSVRVASSASASREQLVDLWKAWMQEAVAQTGSVPPGNERDNDTWVPKKAAKSEIKLTPGKGIQDLTCSVEDLIAQVVKGNKVVAFVKGTRQQPQCGFSYQVLSTLNSLSAEYEVLNVLDEVYNPGLREAIKNYSQWPTIPQLYVGGEFVGGADIIAEMHAKGELKQLLGL